MILPRQALKWVSRQADDTLGFLPAQADRFQLPYTLPDNGIAEPQVEKVLVKVLSRRTKAILPELHGEIDEAWTIEDAQETCSRGICVVSWQLTV